jgi:hypothetical protein
MQRRVVAGAAIAAGLLAAVIPATANTPDARAGAGCANTPDVVAHHPGGKVLHPQPKHVPVACGTSTGYPGAESHLVARPDGTIIFTPAVLPRGTLGIGQIPGDYNGDTQSNASPGALVVTRDEGRHWRVVKPMGVTWNPTDHGDHVDPVTGRMFFEDYGPIPLAPELGPQQEGPAHISVSDDLVHWRHTVISGLTLPENPRFTSARPPAGQDKPHRYPTVTYFCANTNVGFVSPVIGGRNCYRSLDGGLSWEQRSTLLTGAAPQHPECGGQGEVYSAIDGYYPQGAPDGTLYVMIACGGTTYLARSRDEAATFPVVRKQGKPVVLPVPTPGPGDIGGTPELRVLDDGTFVLGYLENNHLFIRLSRTHGLTWTKAMDVTAPGVTAILQWSFAAAGDGDVAFSYLAHRHGQTTWDAWLTATHNVTVGLRSTTAPVFFSGQLNPRGRPLLYGDSVQGSGYMGGPAGTSLPFPPPFNNSMMGNDFIGATIAPDGTPWGSFTQDCGPAPESPGCQRQHGQTRGFAGHL